MDMDDKTRAYDSTFGSTPDAPSTNQGRSGSPPESDKAQDAMSTAQDKVDQVRQKADQAAQEVKGKSEEVKARADHAMHQAQSKADESMDKAAEGVGQAADMLRSRGQEGSGTMANAATSAADRLDNASSYLREKGTEDILQDIESLIRRKPVESLLVAAGAGYVLSKILG
jgi:ElaB/YqjD/DUF883 family membrane-anchored ribosome-binding protein